MEIINPASREEWLKLRSQDLTSTEVPALFGLSPYMTHFELWHRKKEAAVVSIEENDRVKWGTRLQDAIATGIAEDNGWKIRKMEEYIRHGALKIGSSFDFRVLKTQLEFGKDADGSEDELLEIKNVDALVFKDKWIVDGDDMEAPPHIEVQVQHQLLVSQLKKATIGALIGGNKIVQIKREVDAGIANAIKQKAAEFWKSIEQNRPPAPDFSRDAEFIKQLYNFAEPGKVMDASGNPGIVALVAAYRDAAERVKQADKEKDAAKAAMLVQIGDCEKVVGEGWSISAGMVGPAEIAYHREGYRNFRVNVAKKKEVATA